MKTNISAKLINFLGLRTGIVGLLITVVLLETGEKIGERFLPLYITALGGGAVAVAFLNAMDNFLGAVYSYMGGYFSDRIGYKKALNIFTVISLAGYLLVILWPVWQAAVAGAILFIAWSSISLPAIMSAISSLLPDQKHTMGVTMHSMVRRLPMAIGPLIGAAAISVFGEVDGIRIAFVFSFLLGMAGLFVLNRLVEGGRSGQIKAVNPLAVIAAAKPELKHLLVSDVLIRFCEQLPYAFVVIWVMKNIGRNAVEFGLLTFIEMAVAMLIYIPVAYMVEKRKSSRPFVAVTFFFFAIFPAVLYFSGSFPALIFAFIIRGLKEFGEPTRKAMILALSPETNRAQVYGAYYLLRDVIVSFAAFAGGFLWLISPAVNFGAAFIFGLLGLGYFLRYCRE